MMKSLIILCSVVHVALCFCGNHSTLHGKLAESAVQVSNRLRELYGDNVTSLKPHMASSMIVALRLAGHMPHTIQSDLKTTNKSYTVVDYLKSHLDEEMTKNKTISELTPGRIAYIFQAVSALCYDPGNFSGHNLTDALAKAFEEISSQHLSCRNEFEYALVALTACHNLGSKIPPDFTDSILFKIDKLDFSNHSMPDTLAMAVMTLSCLKRNVMKNEVEWGTNVNKVIKKYLKIFEEAFGHHKDELWNAQSKGLVVQAFMSLPDDLRPEHWNCNRLLSSILDKHDPTKAFGNVLANIQILPTLLGRSLLDLNMSCPTPKDRRNKVSVKEEEEGRRNKTVCVELVDATEKHQMPEKIHLVVPENTTAYEILELASKNNSAYKFEVLEFSFGRMITSINGVKQDSNNGTYWLLYESKEKMARDGVDIFIPKNSTCIIFKYEGCSEKNTQKNTKKNTKKKTADKAKETENDLKVNETEMVEK